MGNATGANQPAHLRFSQTHDFCRLFGRGEHWETRERITHGSPIRASQQNSYRLKGWLINGCRRSQIIRAVVYFRPISRHI
jgi:hypothetical protein